MVVRFLLRIESRLQSEFINVMSVNLAKELLAGFGMGLENDTPTQAGETPEPDSEPQTAPTTAEPKHLPKVDQGTSAPTAATPAGEGSGGKLSQDEIERLMRSMGGGNQTAQTDAPAPTGEIGPAPATPAGNQAKSAQSEENVAPPTVQIAPQEPEAQPVSRQVQQVYQAPAVAPKIINTQPIQLPEIGVEERLGKEKAENLDLILSVPLEVSVEIGRTHRKVEEILTYSKGSLVVLDKLAGDQVDLFVNGMCIAKGDVVVIDDNFGIRITEILKKPGLQELAKR